MKNQISVRNNQLSTTHKNYLAKYAVEFFERKKVKSYGLWAIYVKAENGKYPKVPTAYGKTETLEQANLQLTAWCMENNITFEDIRSDMCPWRLVKDLLEGKSGAEFFARGIEKRSVANQVAEQQNPMNDLVHVVGDVAFTDSLKIAEKFSKRHDSVLRAIDNLPKDKFTLLNFVESARIIDLANSGNKKESRYFEITWKGFSMLAMGFTGSAAYQWKQEFLDAFEFMGDYIFRHKAAFVDPPRTALLDDKRKAHVQMMAALSDFRSEQGKETANVHYMSENKLCNAVITGKYESINESNLSNEDADLLRQIRTMNEGLINAGIDYDTRKQMLHKHGIRQRTKLLK